MVGQGVRLDADPHFTFRVGTGDAEYLVVRAGFLLGLGIVTSADGQITSAGELDSCGGAEGPGLKGHPAAGIGEQASKGVAIREGLRVSFRCRGQKCCYRSLLIHLYL